MKDRIKKKIAKNKRREVLKLLDLAMGNKPNRLMTTYLDANYGDYSLDEMKYVLEVL